MFLGKIAPYFTVAALDLVIVVVAGRLLFDVPFRGSLLVFGLGSLLFLFVTLGLGVLISSVSESQGEAIQLAIMMLLPQVLLSGMIFPLASMATGVRWIAYVLPLTYFVDIARGVMLRGAPLPPCGNPSLPSPCSGRWPCRWRRRASAARWPPADRPTRPATPRGPEARRSSSNWRRRRDLTTLGAQPVHALRARRRRSPASP